MPRAPKPSNPRVSAPWLTEAGTLDLSSFPIDSALRQALSPDDKQFHSGCALLTSMCAAGRTEAGLFLIGLLHQYPDDYERLTVVAEALRAFESKATVEALAAELRRVPGSSATRRYLRRILQTFECLRHLASETIEELSNDPQVGPRFRQRLRTWDGQSFRE